MKKIPCHWTNRAKIGEPWRFVVTGYREEEPKKAKPQEELAL